MDSGSAEPDRTRRLWVGTYPEAGIGATAGQGEGIWVVDLHVADRTFGEPRLVAEAPAASFLGEHPTGRVLYALAETAPGTLRAFRLTVDGPVAPPTVVPSGGDGPCHLAVTDRAVYVAHYGDGAVAVHRLTSDGALADVGPAQVHAAPDLGPDTVSRAHFSASSPDGNHLIVCDLGLDVLRRYRVGPDGLLTEDGIATRMPRGTGPRHMEFGPDGLLHVVGEHGATLTTLRWDPVSAEATTVAVLDLTPPATSPQATSPLGTAPLAISPADGVPDAAAGRVVYPAHLVRSGDGIHVSVRSSDEIVTVPHAVASGSPGPLHRQPAGGTWPRHFAVVDGLIVVAAERSHRLTLLAPGGAVLDAVDLPSPACVVPAGSPGR